MDYRQEESLFVRSFYLELFSRLTVYFQKMLKNPSWFLMSLAGRFGIFRSMAVYLTS